MTASTPLTDHLRRCTAALASPNGPSALYAAVQHAMADLVGYRLFTLLVVAPGGAEVERVWTSDPAAYPLQGRKPMGRTEWGAKVLTRGEAWWCNDAAGLRWAFFDHELIASLGCAACLSVPVAAFGRTLGTINILGGAGTYSPDHLHTAHLFAPLLALHFDRHA